MNTSLEFIKILVEEIHSAVIATIDKEGRPVTRVIDLMLYDESGIYFLTATGKEFYHQLMEQGYISLSAVQGKRSISLRGKVQNIGKEKLDEIFVKNPYMQGIYPEGKRDPLEVFRLYEAAGEFFDISEPTHVIRGAITIGAPETHRSGYVITDACIGCGSCAEVCPQNCIDIASIPARIDQNRCLHCGQCQRVCPVNAVKTQ